MTRHAFSAFFFVAIAACVVCSAAYMSHAVYVALNPQQRQLRNFNAPTGDGYWKEIQFGENRSVWISGPWHWSPPAPAGIPGVQEGSRFAINDATGVH